MNYKPIGHRVLVRKTEKEVSSGVLIATNEKVEYSNVGTVEEVGTGIFTGEGLQIPFGVKKGDKVLMPAFLLDQSLDDETDLLIVDERDLISIIVD